MAKHKAAPSPIVIILALLGIGSAVLSWAYWEGLEYHEYLRANAVQVECQIVSHESFQSGTKGRRTYEVTLKYADPRTGADRYSRMYSRELYDAAVEGNGTNVIAFATFDEQRLVRYVPTKSDSEGQKTLSLCLAALSPFLLIASIALYVRKWKRHSAI